MNIIKPYLLVIVLLFSCGSPNSLKRSPSNFLEDFNTVKNLKSSAFYGHLVRSHQILSNPEIPHGEKSAQVDKLFLQLRTLCEADCAKAVNALKLFNNEFVLSFTSKKVSAFIERFDFGVAKESKKRLELSTDQIQSFAKKAQSLFEKLPAEDIVHKINSSAMLLRYVIALEEEALFDLYSRGNRQNAISRVKESVLIYKKQYNALQSLYRVIKDLNGENLSQIPLDDMKLLVNSINDLGLFYMKLAQSVSNNHMLFSADQQVLLKSFQDDVKPMASSEVLEVIEAEFGKPAEELFIDFDPDKPLATGTVAQTYFTKIKTLFGVKEVIVKVQRPGLFSVLDRNRKVNRLLSGSLQVFGTQKMAPYIELLAGQILGLEDAFERELDFKLEAKAISRFRKYFSFHRNVKIPKVVNSFSGKTVLTMEKIEGSNIDSVLSEYVGEKLSERKKIFSTLLDSLLYQTFVMKEVHADMHPGNLLASNGKLGIIDLGQTFNSRGLLTAPIQLIMAVLRGDSAEFLRGLESLGEFPHRFKGGLISSIETNNSLDRRGNQNIYHKFFDGVIRDEFDEAGMKKATIVELINSKTGKFKANTSEDVFKMIGTLINKAIGEYGYRPNPKYVQFFRSLSPVLSTLYVLGKELPKKELKWILIRSSVVYGGIVTTSIAAGEAGRLARERMKKFKKYFYTLPYELNVKVQTCSQLVQRLMAF